MAHVVRPRGKAAVGPRHPILPQLLSVATGSRTEIAECVAAAGLDAPLGLWVRVRVRPESPYSLLRLVVVLPGEEPAWRLSDGSVVTLAKISGAVPTPAEAASAVAAVGTVGRPGVAAAALRMIRHRAAAAAWRLEGVPWGTSKAHRAVVALRNPDGEILWMRRSLRCWLEKTAEEAGRGAMALPGGIATPTDGTPVHTALREFSEETGISVDPRLWTAAVCRVFPLPDGIVYVLLSAARLGLPRTWLPDPARVPDAEVEKNDVLPTGFAWALAGDPLPYPLWRPLDPLLTVLRHNLPLPRVLYHGTNGTGFAGISDTLAFRPWRCRGSHPTTAPCTCSLFGPGLYFAETLAHAASFASPDGGVIEITLYPAMCWGVVDSAECVCACGCGAPGTDHTGAWASRDGFNLLRASTTREPEWVLSPATAAAPGSIRIARLLPSGSF